MRHKSQLLLPAIFLLMDFVAEINNKLSFINPSKIKLLYLIMITLKTCPFNQTKLKTDLMTNILKNISS